MNMDMLSRVFDMIQRVGGMEQVGQLMVIVYGVICVFGLMNCILGYRILRFWMMIFGFLIGAGGGFAATYISGVQDKMVILGAMAGLGIVLAIVSFLIYRAGIFVLGFGIGISLSIYLVHPTSSFSFFLCILIGVGLGVLAMRYAKGVIIIGTSVLGGVLAGISIAQIGGLAQFPYGIGMAAGIALLGMLIQFAINKDHYDEEEDEEEPYEDTDKRIRKKNASNSQEYDSKYNREDLYKNPSDRRSEGRIRNTDSDEMYSRRNTGRNKEYSDRKKSADIQRRSRRREEDSSSDNRRSARSSAGAGRRTASERNSSPDRRRSSTSRNYSSDTRRSQGRNSSGNSGQSGRRSRYNDSEPEDRDVSYYDDVYEEPVDTYDDFERRQQRKRQMDIENMADYDDLKSTEATDTEDYDEWKDN